MAPTKKAAPEKTKQPEKKKEIRVYTGPAVTEFTNKYWDMICLPTLGFGLLILGIVLITLGAVHDIEDLIILGCLLGAGCLVFFFLMYTSMCRPRCQRNIVKSFDLDKAKARPNTSGSEVSALTDYGYYNVAYNTKDEVIKERVLPSEQQLYGEKMRSFMATPATTKDVTFHYDGSDTPPPPRVALPCAPGDKSNKMFTMDYDKMTKSQDKNEMSSLELL